MAQVVCLGELLVDMVSDAGDGLADAPRFLKAPGGAPANVAAGLARLGTRSAFVGKVGDEPFGHWLREVLEKENVDVSHLQTTPEARTTIAFVATRLDGKKDICFYRNPGADALLYPHDIAPGLFDDAAIFHCGSVSLSVAPCRDAQFFAAKMARERNVLVSFDPNWRPSIWPDFRAARELIWQMIALSDIVKIADEEWEFICGTSDLEEGAQKVLAAGPRFLAVTRGANGAQYFTRNRSGEIAGLEVDAIDTLGAGDAFVAGLLSEIARAASFEEFLAGNIDAALRFANACGAFATQRAGAIPSLPTRADALPLLG